MRQVFRAFWVVGYREILRLGAQRARLVASLATPLLFFGLFGAGFNRLIGDLAPGVDFVTFMYPGILAMTVIMPAVFAGMSVVWDREFGFLRELLVAPLSRTGIVLGKIVGGAGLATAEGLVLLLLAPVLGLSVRPLQVLELAGVLLLLAVALSGFGIVIGTRVRTQEVFQTVMALVIFPLIFLSGVFFPVEAVPRWLEALAKVNPVTYGVDAVRQILLDGGPAAEATADVALGVTLFGHRMSTAEDLALTAVLGVVLLTAATLSFGRQG